MTATNVTRFWRKVPETTETVLHAFSDETPRPENMEKLAKNIEIARSHKVHCEAELMSAQELLARQVDALEEELKRRGLLCRK